jgi:predicted alpha/beta hydrolase family esterase
MTYGYDTHLRHVLGTPLNKATVYDIARDFLVALEAERRTDPMRPIFFVAHSLGGIVVKEMLRQAHGCQPHHSHLRTVFDSTAGIIFFGTPHSGADPRGFAQHVVENLVKALGISVNKQIVSALLPSSERLKELKDEFGPIAEAQNWMIHSFQEGLGVKPLNDRKVF